MSVLSSPTAVVVGATDVRAMVEFLGAFGFSATRSASLSADEARALFGLVGQAEVVDLSAAGAVRGGIRVVQAPAGAEDLGPFARGAHAIDVYTTDMARSVQVAESAGGVPGPIGRVELGPLVLVQCLVQGPDGLPFVLVEANRRRSSVLDQDSALLHSQVHSLVWTVDDVEAGGGFWTDEAGLDQLHVIPISHPAVSEFMGLPRPDAQLRMSLLADAEVAPVRLELLAFPDDPAPARAGWPLTAGLHGLVFDVDDLDKAMAGLVSAAFGEVVDLGSGRAVAGADPNGIRFLLEQPR